jgi:hypothetical protein
LGSSRVRQLSVVLAAVAVTALGPPALAPAAETIGETGAPLGCVADQPYAQQEVGAAPGYSPSSYGVITSWSTMSGNVADRKVKLLVQRPDPGTGLNNYIAVQRDQVRVLPTLNELHTFDGIRLPIEADEQIGLYIPGDQPAGWCAFPGVEGDLYRFTNTGEPQLGSTVEYPFSQANIRVNASALVEPDIDRDGFGDETQDQCPTDASTQGPCPTAEPPADTKLEGSASAKGKQKQKGKKIVVKVKVKAEEDLEAKATGKVKVNPTYKLKPKTMQVAGASSKTMQLVPKKKHGKKIVKAMKKGKKAKAKLTVKLTDEAGNTETEKLSVKLKR